MYIENNLTFKVHYK